MVTKLPRQQTPQVAIDAFLDIFSEVRLQYWVRGEHIVCLRLQL